MSRSLRSVDRRLLLIVALALLVRLLAVPATAPFVPRSDAADYDRHAAVIAAGGGYPPTTYAAPGSPSAFRPPAWPYVLGGVYAATGARWTAGRVAGALLGTATVALLVLIALQLWDRRVAAAAGLIAALYPPLIRLDLSLLSETLFVPVVLAMVLALLRARDSPRAWAWLAAAGALVSVAALTRTAGLALLLPVAVATFAAARTRSWRLAAAPAVAAALVLAPWTLRNLDAFDRLVPVSTQSGYTLAGTYNPAALVNDEFQGAGRIPAQVPELRAIIAQPGQTEADLDDRLGAYGRRFALEHPGYVLEAMRLNTLRLLDLAGHGWLTQLSYEEMGIPWPQRWTFSLCALILFGVAAAGAVVLRRRRPDQGLGRGPLWLWAIPVLLWLTVIPITGAPRYRVALDPFLMLLAAVALVHWRDSRRAGSRP